MPSRPWRRVSRKQGRRAVAVADAEVRTVESEIERRTVRAPIAGEVLQVELRAGECALASHNAAPLIVLGAVHPLHLRVDGTSTRRRVCFRRRARHASRGAPAF